MAPGQWFLIPQCGWEATEPQALQGLHRLAPGGFHGAQGLAVVEQEGLPDALGPAVSLAREGASGRTEVESPASPLGRQSTAIVD